MANLYVRSTDGSDADGGTTWALAKATLAGALAIATSADTIWVSDNHAETQAGALTLTCPSTPGLRILCGDDAAEPPTALATTGTITTTGNIATLIVGFAYIFGLSFIQGSGSSGTSVRLDIGTGVTPTGLVFDACLLHQAGTGSVAGAINIGGASASGLDDQTYTFINCTIRLGNVANTVKLQHGRLLFENLALHASGSIPTTLFTFAAGAHGHTVVEASDLSARAFANLASVAFAVPSELTVRNCKVPASIAVVTGTNPGPGGPIVRMHNCDSGDTNIRLAEHFWEGSVVHETIIVRTGGASDGDTPISLKMVSSATPLIWHPLISPELRRRQNTVGAAITVKAHVVTDNVTLTNGEAWIEVQAFNTSGFPVSTVTSDRIEKVITTPANQTTSSEAWTTTGLTTPVKQELSVTFTPQEKGYVIARVMLAKASTTMFVCPKLAIS